MPLARVFTVSARSAIAPWPSLHFASLPAVLRVRLLSGIDLPPAARAAALTVDNLGALLRVAVGR